MKTLAVADAAAPSLALDRGLAILELLDVAERLGIPRSAAHRLLTGLSEHGFVRQETPQALLTRLRRVRARGYSVAVGIYYKWMSALATSIRHPTRGAVIGTVSLAGPTSRPTDARLQVVAPSVVTAARELSTLMLGSAALSHAETMRQAS